MLPDRRSLGDPISEIFFGEETDLNLRSLVEGVLGASPCADDDGRLAQPPGGQKSKSGESAVVLTDC